MTTRSYKDGDNIRCAVLVIVITVFALAFGDAVIKGVSADLSLWQIFTLRSAVVLPALLGFIRLRRSEVSFWPREVAWTVVRSLMLTFMWVTYYAALPHVALSLAAAVYYTLPLFITMFAAVFLGDRVGGLGWSAVGLGFLGVLLILQPDAEGFNWFTLLPLSSAILYALAMILTRSRCQEEHPLILSVWLNFTMLVTGGLVSVVILVISPAAYGLEGQLFMLGSWTPMGASEWGVIGVLSISILVGSIGAAVAYQIGRSATVATFDLAYVAFAAIWGFVLFSEVPNAISLAGMSLVVAAGIIAIRSASRESAVEQPN